MKTTLLTLILLSTLSLTALSQSDTTGTQAWREIGLRLSGADNFNFIYKKQIEANRYRRFRLLFTNIQLRTVNDNGLFNATLGGAIGWEKRKTIAEKVQFIHGWEPFLTLNLNTTDDVTGLGISPGLGYVLGFQVTFSEQFYLALETIPSLNVSISAGDLAPDTFSVGAGFNSNAVALTFVYRFEATKP